MNKSKNSGLKIVIVGASAAGLRAAARAKRLMPESRITVIDGGKIISYGACGLPYYLSGDIESPRALMETSWGTLRDPEFFKNVKGLDVRIQTIVTNVDIESKSVSLVNKKTGDAENLQFDKLVLATGATPIILPGIPANHQRISTFKTVEDAIVWRKKLETGQLEKIAIIGSGFIGIELAEAFTTMWDAKVDLIEMENRILPQILDTDMSFMVEKHLKEQGVRLHKSCRVTTINDIPDGLEIVTDNKTIKTEYAIVGIGVRPRVKLARQMGLKIGKHGGITVNKNLQTSHPDVYAAGDCIEVEYFHGEKAVIPLGSLANKQGRAVGDQLAGRKTSFKKVAGSACVKVFDYNVAATGLSETMAARYGIPTRVVCGTFNDLAHFYPEDKNIFLKLIYNPDTLQILGFQGAGEGNVVKRVDVLGNLLLNKGRLEDLLDLEFAYSPPYASVLDPLYVLGAAALNQEEGIVSQNPAEPLDNGLVLDVRTSDEAKNYPLENTMHVPFEELRERVNELGKNNAIKIICSRGTRSAEATRWFVEAGHKNVAYVRGGWFMLNK
ncbi:MAG: FAD-dependent oxidoreductase [Deltaproteobacteria bacterium]|nr:FAD-dependent oxidoreductase [Deltaproteobacteria bacterium]MBW2662474.1 FAD-dependent oxidoreductase [Deltaproteobacteria bacterium]